MAMLSIGMTVLIFHDEVSTTWLIPAIVVNFIQSFLNMYPLTFFLIFAILRHYLLLFKKVLVQYNQRIQTLLWTSNPKNLAMLLNEGMDIVEALSLLDAIFGGAITTEITLCLMAEIFGFYFGSTLFEAIITGRLLIFLFLIVFVVLGVQGLTRYCILIHNGQALTNVMRECRVTLKNMDIQLAPLTHVQAKQMEWILSRFSEPVAWSPMGLFDLSQSSSLMAHSVIVTYLVVLIQFKGSDVSRK